MLKVGVVSSAVWSVAFATSAHANQLREMGREEKFDRADLVIVGVPTDCPADLEKPCKVRVLVEIKGDSTEALVLERRSRIAELNAYGCKPGHVMLMYLMKWEDRWHSVNGAYGVVDLGKLARHGG
ncbi:MAG: hypothetical protein QOJ94_2836 [Sphingomonadales bacterium]|jgi:hypothetical protein|nr:hypothetical protein [Sphingomonadales bacterium]